MKKIGITNRIEYEENHAEFRDCLDIRWYDFFNKLDYIPVPIPTQCSILSRDFFEIFGIEGVVISGGNSVQLPGEKLDVASEIRFTFEHALINLALESRKPILGVCHGMQALAQHFGTELCLVNGHVNERHSVKFQPENRDIFSIEVNSFHDIGIAEQHLTDDFKALAKSEDALIEAFEHKNYNISGIMWHPERESTFRKSDLNFFKRTFK